MAIGTTTDVESAILDITGGSNFPSAQEVPARWADVADTLLQAVIPTSTTAVPARQAFIQVMGTITANSPGIALLKTAFMAYATTLATGMAPAYTATPPATPPTIEIATSMNTDNARAVAVQLAQILVIWAKTGTATPSTGGPSINWN